MFEHLTIVLVRAENPVNIGQSARAMRNFGAEKLVLVNCIPHRVPEAYTTGWKARDILTGAKRMKSLASALKKGVLAVGFTARAGKRRGAPGNFAALVSDIVEALKHQNVALVFGNEKNGLSNDEIKKCHWLATIPAAPEYTSLNLSHAVAIVLAFIYLKQPQAKNRYQKPRRFYVKPQEFEDLMEDYAAVLKRLGYRNTEKMAVFDLVLNGFRHYLKKSGLDRRELHLFKAFLAKIRQYMLTIQ